MRALSILLFIAVVIPGCAVYKQNIMFKAGENFISEPIQSAAVKAEHNYVIQKNDYITISVYSNNGEKLIEPNPELNDQQPVAKADKNEIQYLIDLNGLARLPMIGEIKLEGLTLRQAEQVLQKEYEKYYKTPFVALKFSNKRVIVLGAPGGKVIPMINENITLSEVLALSGGVGNDAKAHNIRVLRGEKVFVIDLSTVEGYRGGNMVIEHGDIVYVEQVRKPLAEGFRDYGIILTFMVSIVTLVTLFTR